MKKLILLLVAIVSFSFADQYVNGYYKNNGTYVNGHMKTNSNNTKIDNYSTYGNTNPYNGKEGTKKYNDYNNYGSKKSNYYGYGK